MKTGLKILNWLVIFGVLFNGDRRSNQGDTQDCKKLAHR